MSKKKKENNKMLGWTISSFIKCNSPNVGYTQNYVDLCCCTPKSYGDMDNDGITDNIDACPTQYGTKLNNGCPLTYIRKTPIMR